MPVRTVNQSARDVRPPMPTMKDVAARAGVAVSTVSRILNGTGYGSEQTRRRVLAASSALGYLPSLRARGLRQSRTMTIGVAVPDLGNPVFLEYLRGVEASGVEHRGQAHVEGPCAHHDHEPEVEHGVRPAAP